MMELAFPISVCIQLYVANYPMKSFARNLVHAKERMYGGIGW